MLADSSLFGLMIGLVPTGWQVLVSALGGLLVLDDAELMRIPVPVLSPP